MICQWYTLIIYTTCATYADDTGAIMHESTILVIDNNREHLHVLSTLLKEQGYTVRLAPDSQIGLASARANPPDMVLLDSGMPDMSSYEVCSVLKHDIATRDIPIIFMSAPNEPLNKVKALEAGAIDYLTRPFQPEEVLLRIATHLNMRRIQQQFRRQNELLQQEITERQRTETRLRRVERALRALSQSNERMLRAENETDLLHGICHDLVEVSGYRMVWVGIVEPGEPPTIRPMAQGGYEDGYLQTLNINLDETSEHGRGPTSTAIRSGQPAINTNTQTNDTFAPWRAQAHQRGYASSIALPLVSEGDVLGALNVYATEPDAFDDEEVGLLMQLASNLAYGISALHSRDARAHAEQALREQHEQLQTLSRRLVEVQEAERHSIARDLHDEVGQVLTGLSLALELVARQPPEHAPARLEQTQRLVNDLIVRVRDMSMQLRPPMLDDLGLLPALLWYFERFREQTGIRVIFKHTGLEQRFSDDIEVTVYRMIQEGLTNVANHARVAEVVVRLLAGNTHLDMQIEDQGCGFDAEAALHNPATSGLSGMRERMRLLGGDLQIDTEPARGSCLTVHLPIPRGQAGQHRRISPETGSPFELPYT
jgi:signal transduction histidine kinase/DNA-binding response OmpR family regulator